MSGGRLNANADQYLQAAAENAPPPTFASDPLVAGLTPIEQLLRVLGLAANADDPRDGADVIAAQAERDAQAIQAADNFTAQDANSTAELNSVAEQDQIAQIAQQLPQMISGIAGALAGALGGALQPLTQIPQQIAQGAAQNGMGIYQAAGDSEFQIDDLLNDAPLPVGAGLDEFGDAGFSSRGGGAGAGGGGLGNTTPTAVLGPPPVPSASTSPASAPFTPITTPAAVATTSPPVGGMAGMPVIPPGAMHGATTGEKDVKTDTKRVSVPPVRNGSPVQGRLTAPSVAPTVIKKVEGKPVTTKRIIAPDADGSDADDPVRR